METQASKMRLDLPAVQEHQMDLKDEMKGTDFGNPAFWTYIETNRRNAWGKSYPLADSARKLPKKVFSIAHENIVIYE